MVAIHITNFAGMLPIQQSRLLPDNAAQQAVNAYLRGGDLRGLRQPRYLAEFPAADPDAIPPVPVIKRAYRIPDPAVPDTPVWVGFFSRYAKMFPNPLVNDAFSRFIFCDGNAPGTPQPLFQNTLQRFKDGDSSFLLGVPAPENAMTLIPGGGSSGINETRTYYYTYVNQWGEEGQPSPFVIATGQTDDAWGLSDIEAPVDYVDRGLTDIRIYRTITGATGTFIYLVATIDIADVAYSDTRTNLEVATEGVILASETWAEPLPMEGVIALPNGFFAGWSGKNIYFSEPYRPWAWPAEYSQATEYDIIDCGVIEQTLVVLTKSGPLFLAGIRPENMSQTKTQIVEPCIEPTSVVQAPEALYYASANGLMAINSSGMANVTRDVIGRDIWVNDYVPRIKAAVSFDGQYIAVNDDGGGFIFATKPVGGGNAESGIVDLNHFTHVENLWTDPYTGEAHLIENNTIWSWAVPQSPLAVAEWLSKEYQFEQEVNLGAVQVNYDSKYRLVGDTSFIMEDQPPTGGPWPELVSIIGAGLFNGAVIAEDPEWDSTPPENPDAHPWPYWYGIVNSGVEYPLPPNVKVLLSVFSGGALIFQQAMESGVVRRLPSGFKSDTWQIHIKTRVPVYNVQIAETVKELNRV